MAVYYFDTSALVKRYAQERGTNWVISITDPAFSNSIYIVRITAAEVVAAISGKVRLHNQITQADAASAITNFKYDLDYQYSVIEVTPDIVVRAMDLAEKHPLRGYDAVQLAAAIQTNADGLGIGLPALTIVCADEKLNKAANVAGLIVEDPNNYP